MRPQPISPARAGSTPLALRGKGSLRTVLATAVAAAVGFAPVLMIASPAMAAPNLTYSIVGAVKPTPEGGNVTYTISRAGQVGDLAVGETVTFTLTGTATSGDDYVAPVTMTAVFAANATTATAPVVIPTIDDDLDEVDETLVMTVVSSSVGTATSAAESVTITDLDAAPGYTLTTNKAVVNESGSTLAARTATITATLDEVSDKAITIPVTTGGGTATAGEDYTDLVDGVAQIEIEAGDPSGSIDVVILNDDIDEAALQDFTITGEAGTNVTGTESVDIDIADDDAAPVITINDAGSAVEGADLTFEVELSHPSDFTVEARWDTADGAGIGFDEANGSGPATDDDYRAESNEVVSFAPRDQSEDIVVETLEDSIDELNPEYLQVELSEPENGTIESPGEATGEISDTDDAPSLTVTPGTVTEGDSGTLAKTFTVELSDESGMPITVDYDVAQGSGTATDGADFTATSGELTFAPGDTEKTFTVDILGDTVDEGTGETFAIDLDSDAGVDTDSLGETLITITDNDDKPTFTVESKTMMEGDSASAALLAVTLSNASSSDVVFDVSDITTAGMTSAMDGTTTWGSNDYDAPATTMRVQANQLTGYVFFIVNGDEIYEPDETLSLRVALPSQTYATGSAKTSTLTLTNDDLAPVLTVNSVSGVEGTDVAVTGVISGMAQYDTLLNVSFAGGSVNGSDAAEVEDFVNPGAVAVNIAGGTMPGTVRTLAAALSLTEDTLSELSETIVVSGTGFGNVGSVTSGTVTIAASDGGVDPSNPTDPTDPTSPDAVTLNGPPHRILKGTVKLSGATDVSTEVELWSAPYNGGPDSWVSGGTVTSGDDDGVFVFNPTLTTTGRKFVARVSETVASDEVLVRMRQLPTLAGNSSTRGIAALRAAGGIPRTPFIIQRWNGKGWSSLFTGNLMSDGSYYKALKGQPSGSNIAYRVYVYGSTANGVDSAYSPLRYVRIR